MDAISLRRKKTPAEGWWLTGKNLTLIRQVLTEGIWSEVVSLPNALMRQARADQAHAPVKAAVTAQLAVAIAILSFAPVRLTNLVSIELDKNLIKPGAKLAVLAGVPAL